MIIFFLIIRRDTPHHIHAQRQNHWRSWIGLLSRGVKENNAGNRSASVPLMHPPTRTLSLSSIPAARTREGSTPIFIPRPYQFGCARNQSRKGCNSWRVEGEPIQIYLIKNIYTNIYRTDRQARAAAALGRESLNPLRRSHPFLNISHARDLTLSLSLSQHTRHIGTSPN